MNDLPPFADLHKLPEELRIATIGRLVADEKMVVGFLVEDKAKADRYLARLMRGYPELIAHKTTAGPFPGTLLVRVGPRINTFRPHRGGYEDSASERFEFEGAGALLNHLNSIDVVADYPKAPFRTRYYAKDARSKPSESYIVLDANNNPVGFSSLELPPP